MSYPGRLYGGGDKNESINLKFTKEFTSDNSEISTTYFKNYINLVHHYWTLFDDNYKKAAIFTSHLYPYELIYPQDFITFTHREVHQTMDRSVTIKYLMNQEVPKFGLIKYHPFTDRFFHVWELLKTFPLIDGRKRMEILEISNNPTFLEGCHYYEHKYKNISSNYHLRYYANYDYYKGERYDAKMKYLSYYQRYVKMKTTVLADQLSPNQLEIEGPKYDLIMSNLGIYDDRIDHFLEHLNLPIILGVLCLALNNLEIGGSLVIVVEKITTKAMADLFLIGGKFFEEAVPYYNKIHNLYKFSGTNLVFTKFKGLKGNRTELFDQLLSAYQKYDRYDSSGVIFNIDDKQVRRKYEISKPLVPGFDYKYIESILSADDSEYDVLRHYNEELYFKKVVFMRKLMQLKTSSGEERKKLIEQYKKSQVVKSVLWAQEFDQDYLEFEKKSFDSKFGQLILEDMYTYQDDLVYDFKTINRGSNRGRQLKKIEILPEFERMKRALFLSDRLIDTRNIEQWYQIKLKVRYYRPLNKELRLVDYVQKNYANTKISQAWLKMYEIISVYNLIPRKRKTYRTFHSCEAPGNFISAINHYVKTKTEIEDLDWMAQSLKPTKENQESGTGFGDSYGYIRRYPDRWDWGVNGTGDIMDPENIKGYARQSLDRNVDLMTSDCGIPWSEESEESGIFQKLFFSQILFMLNNLPKGKDFVAKMFLPVAFPTEINLYYLLWLGFRKMSFYKSVINPYSKEFYVVCQDYQGTKQTHLDAMFDNLRRKNFDRNFDLFDGKYPADFQYQLRKGLRLLVDRYIFNIERQLYYVDNIKKIETTHLKKIQKVIMDKNEEWIHKFRIKKIDRDDLL